MALARKKTPTKASARRRATSKAKGESKGKSKAASTSSKTQSGSRRVGKVASRAPTHTKGDPLDDLIQAAGPAFRLNIKPEWTSAVRANLQVIFRQAALFA